MSTSEQSLQMASIRLLYPESLPISARRLEIVEAIRKHQIVIVAGETGSGKTTQLPKMCLEAGLGLGGKIGCTQPRRIAALSVSKRIAEELGIAWGDFVGCKIRFADKTRPSTKVKVMTDGILLAETRGDPLLSDYGAIIIDEAHERSLNIDFLIGYLRTLVKKRPDLKVVITSATIDTQLFSAAFDNAPIFEVSGRSFPVEIRYAPLDVEGDDGETSYVEGAVSAVEEIMRESHDGDVLVFMPSERDIRETREKLTGRYSVSTDVLALMGSLSAGEQERVFAPSQKRKIIVATNIAETSLTIPNIRYVVDTGLARVSRYTARTRTKRLPIEPIAQSSANQRAGRAGRVRAGICVRLYSEEDFNERPAYAVPEIARTNLAEVILQMKAFSLGEIESFPFLQPPDQNAIRGGYSLLQELGALDSYQGLTEVGRALARLPVDPTIGRMLLQARRERCIPQIAAIAAGMSIQDPRERPLEKREKAEEAHKQFRHSDSDFLTLLNIWKVYNQKWQELKTSNQVRKYCKANYLSFLRMKEWSEMYDELIAAVSEDNVGKSRSEPIVDPSSIKPFDGNYRAIHRSILSGALSQIAYRADRNLYRGCGNRELAAFPGSTLFEHSKREKEKVENKLQKKKRGDPAKEQWIVAGEVLETSRVFARTAAPIAPLWIEEVGAHLVKRTFDTPEWSSHGAGNVSARERVTLGGLVIAYRRIDYGRVAPELAKDIFIRSALLSDENCLNLEFVSENRRTLDNVSSRLARIGRLNSVALQDRLVSFYFRNLPQLSSTSELVRFAKEQLKRDPKLLLVSTEELLGDEALPDDSALYPNSLEIGGTKVDLTYRYEPGGSRDGVTVRLPLSLAKQLPSHVLDSVIPGIREQQVLYILRGLPKKIRAALEPVEESSRLLAGSETLSRGILADGLSFAIRQHFKIEVPAELLHSSELPDHLRPRIEVTDGKKLVGSGRQLSQLQSSLPATELQSSDLWSTVRRQWEKDSIAEWDFGDLPEKIEVSRIGDAIIYLYPAVIDGNGTISIRLLDNRDAAVAQSASGIDALLRKKLNREIQEIEKQAKQIDACKTLITLFTTIESLRSDVVGCVLGYMFERPEPMVYRQRDFEALRDEAKRRMPNLVGTVVTLATTALELRKRIVAHKKPYQGMRADLDELLPPHFLVKTPFAQLQHLPRFLKAMLVRAERASSDPNRDKANATMIKNYGEKVRRVQDAKRAQSLMWMIEELKVSIFAQELGTAYPVSPTRVEKALNS